MRTSLPILDRFGRHRDRTPDHGTGDCRPGVGAVSIAAGPADLDALRQWDATVDDMARTGRLVAVSRVNDPSLEGRTHDYLAQYHAGVPVRGAGVSRQLDRSGVTVSLFGTLHRSIDVDTAPALSAAEVVALLERPHGGAILAGGQPRMTILPLLDGSHTPDLHGPDDRSAPLLRRRRRRAGRAHRAGGHVAVRGRGRHGLSGRPQETEHNPHG